MITDSFKVNFRMILEGAVYPLWRLLETPCAGDTSRSIWGHTNPPSLSTPLSLTFASPVHSSQADSGAGVFPGTSSGGDPNCREALRVWADPPAPAQPVPRPHQCLPRGPPLFQSSSLPSLTHVFKIRCQGQPSST